MASEFSARRVLTVIKKHWQRRFSKLPSWPCPRCQVGSLVLNDDALKIIEPQWSKDGRSHDAWEPEWMEERFSCLVVCQNRECGEVVAIGGSAEHVEDHDWSTQQMNWSRTLLPKSAVPGPPIFPIPEQCPEGISRQITKAFSLYWSDPESCANRLRVAVEIILTTQRIPKTVLNKKGKREPLALHSRIEKFKSKNPEAANYLLAIKWLGNAGSHSSLDEIDDDDLLGGFELIEHVIERLYVKREERLKLVAKKLNLRRGKPVRRRRGDF